MSETITPHTPGNLPNSTDRAAPDGGTPPAAVLRDDERQRCEIWTRVMGYHRPVSSFNRGKKGEFHERRYFREDRAGLA